MIGKAALRRHGLTALEVTLQIMAGNVSRSSLLFRFHRTIDRIAKRYGALAATRFTDAILRYQRLINDHAVRSAIASGDINALLAAVDATKLQSTAGLVLQQPLTGAAQAAGTAGAAALRARGLQARFNAVHPNVLLYARTQAAQQVVGIPAETRKVIQTVIEFGSARGLTVAQQARAIRQVVGLPPNWAQAPLNFAQELRDGDYRAASRRLSAVERQQVRSAIANDTVDEAFIAAMQDTYAERLVNLRALNIARTETMAAANWGAHESWRQAKADGDLPGDVRRYWIVTPDERLCPICSRIPEMNPDGRGIDEPFFTPEGVVMDPPVHTDCRCGTGLLLPGQDAEEAAA